METCREVCHYLRLFIVRLTHPPPPPRAQEQVEMAKHNAERPKVQQQSTDLKCGLSAVADDEWENIPEVGNLTRKKRREERSYVVPDSILIGDCNKTEFENALDPRQQQVGRYLNHEYVLTTNSHCGGFETPGTLTNFVEIVQARDKILSLKLDQVLPSKFFVRLPILPLSRFLVPPPAMVHPRLLTPKGI